MNARISPWHSPKSNSESYHFFPGIPWSLSFSIYLEAALFDTRLVTFEKRIDFSPHSLALRIIFQSFIRVWKMVWASSFSVSSYLASFSLASAFYHHFHASSSVMPGLTFGLWSSLINITDSHGLGICPVLLNLGISELSVGTKVDDTMN